MSVQLKKLRNLPANTNFSYRGCKASAPALVDELISSGKITIELE